MPVRILQSQADIVLRVQLSSATGHASRSQRRVIRVGVVGVTVRSLVIITMRCPVDGPVAITALDVDEVVVRSGSDVRATIRCPNCGAVLRFTSNPEPGLLHWALGALREAGEADAVTDEDPHSEELPQPMEAYLEYFRRELDATETLDQMISLMDLADRPRQSLAGRSR
jgi:hypothetical protein